MKTEPPLPEREEWRVLVLDAVRREPCHVIIAVAEYEVVVVPPTAAGYVIPRQSEQAYQDALLAARNVAERRRQGYLPEAGGSACP